MRGSFVALALALAALQLSSADVPYQISRVNSKEGSLLGQQQCSSSSQNARFAYVEPMALMSGRVGTSQVPSTSSRPPTCARPLGDVHVAGRPAPSLSSLQQMANSMRMAKPRAPLRSAPMKMQADSFDPLGLGAGLGAMNVDLDTAVVQKSLWSAAKAGDLEGIDQALSGGADVNFKYPEEGDATAMQCAALNGNTEAVAKLAKMGGNVNAVDKYGWQPLHDAALNGHKDTIAKLVSLGADVNAKTDVEDDTPGTGGRTPLSNAAMNGHTAVVEQLVKLGADINIRQKDGWTPLHFAAKNGWDETVATLVKLGIDVNVKNDVDMTALHYAAWDSTIETCQKLIDLGVDVGHKAKGKLSALDLAEKRKKEKAGRAIAAVLRKSLGLQDAVVGAAASGEGEEMSPPDSQWRELLMNDPYAKSSEGGDV